MTATADHIPGILPQHLKKLRGECGLTDETIKNAGIHSETEAKKLAAILGRRRPWKNMAPALVIPFRALDGGNGYDRIRCDTPRIIAEKPRKYESPPGVANRVYWPPGVAEVVADPASEIIFTEGEFKSLKATQEGFPCIGLVGVYGWKEKNHERMLPELERIAWQGRPVRIVFDSDIVRKSEVQIAEAKLAKALTDRGAKVLCARLPDGPVDPETGEPSKMGLDDFLVARGALALRMLLDNAIEPEPLSAAEGKENAKLLDPSDESKAFLKASESNGLPRLRFWRSCWMAWSGGAYREQEPEEIRARLIREFLDKRFYKLGSGAINNVLDHLRANALLSGSTEPNNWIIEAPPGWEPCDILATKKSLVNLRTLESRPTTAGYFNTAALAFDFNQTAPPPETWINFLDQLWPDDQPSIDALQEFMGYTLTPDMSQQKMLLVVGPPRGGKGTIARIHRQTVGRENTCGPTLASFAAPFGLSALVGKSLGIISDARLSGKSDQAVVTERLLSISGEDELDVDRKFLPPIKSYKFTTRLVILSNELPRIADASGALASRFIVLRLRESFLGREDPALFQKMVPELPGILRWCIAGWQRLHQRGHFEQPESGKALIDVLNELASPVGTFVKDRCVLGPDLDITRKDLFAAYIAWCKDQGRDHVDDEAGFGRSLRAAVTTVGDSHPRDAVTGKRTRYYTGITLNPGF
jgi:putative DNA primase/helicase